MGRRENIVDIAEPEPQSVTLKALAQQLRPDAAKIFNKELDELSDPAEVAEHQVNLDVNSQPESGEANSLRATLTSSSPDPDQRASIQTNKQNSNKLRSDALIVAAFLGNTAGFSSNINSIIKDKKTKLNTQTSSPQQQTSSLAVPGDSLSSRSLSMSTNETRSKLRDQKRASNMEMSTINSHASPGSVINKTTQLDANNSNSNTNSSKNNLRVTAGASRASKRMHNFNFIRYNILWQRTLFLFT